MDMNQFTGTIPKELANLTELTEFRANYNRLTGRFPPEICELMDAHALEFIAVDCLSVTDCSCCNSCA
jgi:hypothetical protein